MADKMREDLGDANRDRFTIDDGHTMTMVGRTPVKGHGSSGASHSGSPESYKGSVLDDASGRSIDRENGGIGDMPMRTVGSMAMTNYGADLSPDATNSLGTFSAESDPLDPALMPRAGSDRFAM